MGTTELPNGNFPDLISEVRTWKKSAGSQLVKLFNDYEEIAQKFEAQHTNMKKREKELEKREAELQKERMQLDSQKKLMLETAAWKKKKAEEQKREKEELQRRIVELEKKLDAKQALELAVKVFRESFGDVETGFKNMVIESD